jgi:excisionase family DNA binding protein
MPTDFPALPPPSDLLTPKQVAHDFGVTPRTVLKWIDSGHLEAFRIGRAIRISRVQLFHAATGRRLKDA